MSLRMLTLTGHFQLASSQGFSNHRSCSLTLNLGLRRIFRCMGFYCCRPILGSDFLHHLAWTSSFPLSPTLSHPYSTNPRSLLSSTGIKWSQQELITTPAVVRVHTGLCVHTHSSRQLVRAHVDRMVLRNLTTCCIIHPSFSSWHHLCTWFPRASPGDWQPCGISMHCSTSVAGPGVGHPTPRQLTLFTCSLSRSCQLGP